MEKEAQYETKKIIITLLIALLVTSSLIGFTADTEMVQEREPIWEGAAQKMEEPLDLNNPDERYVIALSPEERAEKRAEITANIEQDLPQLQEKWARMEAQGISSVPSVPQLPSAQLSSEAYWGNPLSVAAGCTMLDSDTRLILDLPYSSDIIFSEDDILQNMQRKIDSTPFPITRIYHFMAGMLGIDRVQMGDSWTYAAYVTACNIPLEYFNVSSDGTMSPCKEGIAKIDFEIQVMEVYPDPYGGIVEVPTTYYFMVDMVISSQIGMKAGYCLPLEYHMEVGDMVTCESVQAFLTTNYADGYTYYQDGGYFTYIPDTSWDIVVQDVYDDGSCVSDGVARQEGNGFLIVTFTAGTTQCTAFFACNGW